MQYHVQTRFTSIFLMFVVYVHLGFFGAFWGISGRKYIFVTLNQQCQSTSPSQCPSIILFIHHC